MKYNYSLTKCFKKWQYTAIKQIHFVDLLEDKELSNFVQYLTFEKQFKSYYSGDEVSVSINLLGLELPDNYLLSYAGLARFLLYKLESLKYNIVIRLNAEGEMLYLENKSQLNAKWLELRDHVLSQGSNSSVDELIVKGDLLFGMDTFHYDHVFKQDSFFRALFPSIYSSDLDDTTLIRKENINSLALASGRIEIPIEVCYDNLTGDKREFELSFLYDVIEEESIINAFNGTENMDFELLNYVYQHGAQYKFDKEDALVDVEYRQIESINGEMDVIEYVKLSRM